MAIFPHHTLEFPESIWFPSRSRSILRQKSALPREEKFPGLGTLRRLPPSNPYERHEIQARALAARQSAGANPHIGSTSGGPPPLAVPQSGRGSECREVARQHFQVSFLVQEPAETELIELLGEPPLV